MSNDLFEGFPKMARLRREIIVSEKIDGTNAQIFIQSCGTRPNPAALYIGGGYELYAGSRTLWITPQDDNYGFAAWALEHAKDLLALGEGRHFGEWYGRGIQRNYGLAERRFALFNAPRWELNPDRPGCCSAVPILYRGDLDLAPVDAALDRLRREGSAAVSGFMNPEGIIVYHTAAGVGFKQTIEKDKSPKSKT